MRYLLPVILQSYIRKKMKNMDTTQTSSGSRDGIRVNETDYISETNHKFENEDDFSDYEEIE
jgi:hypothetical protein